MTKKAPVMNFIDATCGASRASTCDGLRPLQRQKPAGEHRLDLAGRGEVLLHMREVGVLAGGVEHHQQVIARAGDHQIVEDAAGIVGELRVALLAGLPGP